MNLNATESAAQLRDAGYEVIHEIPGRVCIFAHPQNPDEVAELRPLDNAARAWTVLCRTNEGNSLFPVIYRHAEIDDATPLQLTIRESLLLPGTLDRCTHAPVIGMGRALGLLLSGDDDHAAAHRKMLAKQHIALATQAIARIMIDYADKDEALAYDHGMDEALTCHAILFRPANKRLEPVFTNPFRAVTVRDEAHRATLRAEAVEMLRRVTIAAAPPRPAPS